MGEGAAHNSTLVGILADPAALSSNHGYGVFSQKMINVAELIDSSAPLRVRVDSG